ncbi:hypothetical protein ETD86_15490 [Nonomuraea turkmeniaca]|uniref:Uncharacterized protein n=1 Tax=Nonomuraea turkmeniaca TaxID=103838 RepID=A0A5S4FL26_9ACTN|nr:hypothetical protein [Nonomuraea turkmeniaca]TMR21428.1 hypothetical protein ETD86_15490 [Nonomuraea turkmeniaca]
MAARAALPATPTARGHSLVRSSAPPTKPRIPTEVSKTSTEPYATTVWTASNHHDRRVTKATCTPNVTSARGDPATT